MKKQKLKIEVEVWGISKPKKKNHIRRKTMPLNSKRLRKEFHNQFPLVGTDDRDFDGGVVREEVADWWLSKLDESLESLKKKIRRKIESLPQGQGIPGVLDLPILSDIKKENE